jgi:hypothetical protein
MTAGVLGTGTGGSGAITPLQAFGAQSIMAPLNTFLAMQDNISKVTFMPSFGDAVADGRFTGSADAFARLFLNMDDPLATSHVYGT